MKLALEAITIYFIIGFVISFITIKMALSMGERIYLKQRILVVLIWFFFLVIMIRAYLNPNKGL